MKYPYGTTVTVKSLAGQYVVAGDVLGLPGYTLVSNSSGRDHRAAGDLDIEIYVDTAEKVVKDAYAIAQQKVREAQSAIQDAANAYNQNSSYYPYDEQQNLKDLVRDLADDAGCDTSNWDSSNC